MKRIGLFLLFVGLISGWSQADAQTIKLTGQQTSNANGSVTPTLTWCTELTATPGVTCGNSGQASACSASGDWTGSKTGSGTQTLPSITSSKTYNLSCSWPGADSVSLSWTPPTTNDDGSPLTDLKGFKIYYSTSASMSSNQIKDIPSAGTTSTTLGPLAPGTYYLVMTAYNVPGIESVKTPIVTRTLAATSTVSQSFKITFPSAPTNFKVE